SSKQGRTSADTSKNEFAKNDSIQRADSLKHIALADSVTNVPVVELDQDSVAWAKIDSLFHIPERHQKVLAQSLSQARYVKNNISMQATRDKNLTKEINTYIIEKNKKYAQAVACLIMFLIGAPLVDIIKTGG